jgi:hypothetical protein
MIKKLLAVFILTFAVCTSANAQFISGNKLLSYLNSTNQSEMMSGVFYVAGVLDKAEEDKEICSPNNATLRQAQSIVKKSLENLPEYLHLNASLHVFLSLKKAWPCPKQ